MEESSLEKNAQILLLLKRLSNAKTSKLLPKNFPLEQINVMTRTTGCSNYFFFSSALKNVKKDQVVLDLI